MRRLILVLLVMAAALTVASGVALAVDKVGTNHADVLIGTNKADNLSGKGSVDILDGKDGNDTLQGGPGPDSIDCGRGFDRVLADRMDNVDGNCERVRILNGSVK